MNVKDLIHEIWQDERCRKIKMTKSQIQTIIEVMRDVFVENLLSNNKIKIQNLFTLHLRPTKGRQIKDLVNGGLMELKDYYKLVATPSKSLKEGMKQLKK